MAVRGRGCLLLALATCGYGVVVSLNGARTGRREGTESGRRGVYAFVEHRLALEIDDTVNS